MSQLGQLGQLLDDFHLEADAVAFMLHNILSVQFRVYLKVQFYSMGNIAITSVIPKKKRLDFFVVVVQFLFGSCLISIWYRNGSMPNTQVR